MFSVFLSAVVVALLAGYYFLGNFLCERKEFCDISLYYNPDEVLEATRFKISVLKISFCFKSKYLCKNWPFNKYYRSGLGSILVIN